MNTKAQHPLVLRWPSTVHYKVQYTLIDNYTLKRGLAVVAHAFNPTKEDRGRRSLRGSTHDLHPKVKWSSVEKETELGFHIYGEEASHP